MVIDFEKHPLPTGVNAVTEPLDDPSWERDVADLLGELSQVQSELLDVLTAKRGMLVAADTAGMQSLQAREQELADRLIADYGVTRVIKRRKTSASIPAPAEIVRELADECDLVITGSGD